MTLALLRKDIRLLRFPFIGGLVLAVLPYVLHVPPRVGQWWQDRQDTVGRQYPLRDGNVYHAPPTAPDANRQLFGGALSPAALAGLGLVVATAAACGGIAFAAERRDRSAEFLAMLRVSRRRVATSKLVATLLCLLFPAALHLTVLALGWRQFAGRPRETVAYEQIFLVGAANCAALTLMAFGVAWLLSSFFQSPAIAAAVAIGAAAVAVYVVAAMAWQVEVADDRKSVYWTPSEYVTGVMWRPRVFELAPPATHAAVRTVATLCGVSALIGGAMIYVRRVPP